MCSLHLCQSPCNRLTVMTTDGIPILGTITHPGLFDCHVSPLGSLPLHSGQLQCSQKPYLLLFTILGDGCYCVSSFKVNRTSLRSEAGEALPESSKGA